MYQPTMKRASKMAPFTLRDFNELLELRSRHCISIYLPTHPSSDEGKQDRIVLRNLMDEARDALVARGLHRGETESLIAPGMALLEDQKFWHDRSAGLALFLSGGQARHWRLPRSFESLAWVGDRFYAKPLFPLFDETGRYYLLALSQKGVRLFSGRPDHLAEVPVEGLPHGIDEIASHEPPEGTRQCHTGQKALGGKEGEIFHGQGGAHDHAKQHDLVIYLRAVDRALSPVLHGQTVPLIFVGVEDLFPHYRQVNSYPYMLAEAIHTNPDRLNAAELQARAASVLQPYWLKAETEDLARFDAALGSGRVSGSIEEILRSAECGRVDCLFVAGDAQLWGHWDPITTTAQIFDVRDPNAEDLLDLAAVLVHRQHGRIHVLKAKSLPGGITAAAIFRYAHQRQPLISK
ncbi:MAG TPA: hypothetical protein VHV55_17345 [Pirellulales bacterium]|jgi:hypothetical protein|nr:hypothetical protein [Pirellulales bacterium]